MPQQQSLDPKALAKALQAEGTPWIQSETSMFQLEEDERVKRLGFTPAPGEITIEEAAVAFQQGLTAAVPAGGDIGLPAKIDHRSLNGHNYTTPVKNQGGCGSCVAFGTVGVMETTYKRKANLPTAAVDLSEAHMFYCHGRSEGRNCANGWWPENALKKGRDIGVTFEAKYPYTPADQACSGLASDWQQELAKVTSFTKLSSPAAMKQHLANHGSITGCFIVYQDFFSYGGGVYRHVSGEQRGGHCVEIIGYDDSQGCWIAKNSWGTGWGESGFFRIAYGQCAIETWSGPWGVLGVTMRNWHRNVRVTGLWTNTADRNAFAFLSGVGWRKVTDNSRTQTEVMLSQLVAAKSAGSPVTVLDQANELVELYV